jgi:hypothetical protein
LFPSSSHQYSFILISSHQYSFVLISSQKIPLVPINSLFVPIKILLFPWRWRTGRWAQVSTKVRLVRDSGRVVNGAPQFVGTKGSHSGRQTSAGCGRAESRDFLPARFCRGSRADLLHAAVCHASSCMCATQEILATWAIVADLDMATHLQHGPNETDSWSWGKPWLSGLVDANFYLDLGIITIFFKRNFCMLPKWRSFIGRCRKNGNHS